ncbi:MAG: hypothetical protein ACRDJC_02580 [Thermomicrobiales bacterium]
MDSYYEIFDLASGNMVEDYDRERDAIEALMRVVGEHGRQAIATFALTSVQDGQSTLIAMQDDLVARVEQEMRELIPQRRSS